MKIINTNILYRFTSIRYTFSEAKRDIIDTLFESPPKPFGFEEWKQQTLEKLKTYNDKGPIFFGQSHQFTHNPHFRIWRPLTDNSKTNVYNTWCSDTAFWTPRRLSAKFKISIERAEAIIKLKRHQECMIKKGFKINQSFIDKIQHMLDSTNKPISSIIDRDASNTQTLSEFPNYQDGAIVDTKPKNKPTLVLVPNDFVMTPELASKIIKKPLIKIDSTFLRPIIPFKPENTDSLVISKDDTECSRRNFIFMDTSSNSPSVIIRESSGILRHATIHEQEQETRRIHGKKMNKFYNTKISNFNDPQLPRYLNDIPITCNYDKIRH